MRENYSISLIGKLIQLVPYRKKFVERYHRWMQSPELLELTASEPLSIEEEYEMQQTWRDDKNKCTFIVLTTNENGSDESGSFCEDEDIKRMIGDVNIFLSCDDEGRKCAEIDVMIAEPLYRREGCGREAILLMLWYALRLDVERVFAKINSSNTASMHLFERFV
jgi:RimJ/RimL family protein N-acetyltransferase